MTIYNPYGTHSKYTQVDRHFAPQSEIYTGADSLITAQRNGWELANIVHEEQIELRGGRYTSLYYFTLIRGSVKMTMPIVSTPYIKRMMQNRDVRIQNLDSTQQREANLSIWHTSRSSSENIVVITIEQDYHTDKQEAAPVPQSSEM